MHAQATLAPILKKQDGNIDWKLPARAIHNRIRAFHPWPGTRTVFREVVLQDSQIAREGKSRGGNRRAGNAGCRHRRASDFSLWSCGDGVLLELLEVQLPNRKPQTGLDFVNGFRIATGEKLRHVE